MKRKTFLCVTQLVCLATADWARGEDTRRNLIVDGIVARSNAIYGIQIEYEYEGRIHEDERTLQTDTRRLAFVVQGEDWLLRHLDSNNFRMSRNQSSLKFYEAPTADDRIDRSLHVREEVNVTDLIHEHASHAAIRLGTFWFKPQAGYIDQHRMHATHRPTQTIDGMETEILEWKVQASDFDEAMIIIPRPIARQGSGLLRVYACETLNWALPRVDYCTLNGTVKRRFEATKFTEVTDGIFFPQAASSRRLMGNRQDRSDFRIEKVSSVNAKMAEDTFDVRVPVKTRIRDARPGMATAVFSLQDPRQLDRLLSSTNPTARRGPLYAKPRQLLLLANLVLIISLATYWMYHRCHSPKV